MEKQDNCKIILISGFLGSGKTSLIDRILKAPSTSSKRLAVIQNEFSSAAMGLEVPLMKDSDGNDIEGFYEMPNGCLCCSVKDDLINTLDQILNVKKVHLDAILIETSGLADPSSLIKTFWLDEGMGTHIQIHSFIAVVDSSTFQSKMAQVEKEGEFTVKELLIRQLVFADIVLLNKVDLVKEEEKLKEIEQVIRQVNSSCVLIPTQYSQFDLEYLWSVSFERNNKNLEQLEHHSKLGHSALHKFIDGIESVQINIPGLVFDKEKMEVGFGELLWEVEGMLLMRCKGVFRAWVEGEEATCMVQAVEDIFEIKQVAHEAVDGGRFLFVGKNVNQAVIEEKIKACSI